jgi:ABC-2 type transport system ATP-binding protein
MAKSAEYAIETIGLTKVFPDWWGRAKVVAVDRLDLKVGYKQVYGLLGPNGSGKTTTLKMLLNLLRPTRGRAMLLGSDCRDKKVKQRVGYLPEESYLYKYLNARETLEFYGRLFDLPRKVRRERIDMLLEMVGLAAMSHRAVGTYSKGMARRIGLAQALINDPDVLILDEPTSGMDPIGTRQMKDLILKLAERGKTILLCSHLLADVEDVCDRIGILYGGKMQQEGAVRELLKKSDRSQLLTGRLSEHAAERIRCVLAEEGYDAEISEPMERLEEYFIETVTSAKAQEQPSSGAAVDTKIGGFLTEKGEGEEKEKILDKLVGGKKEDADIEQVGGSRGEFETEKTERFEKEKEEAGGGADSEFLKGLTVEGGGSAETEKPDKVDTEEPVIDTENAGTERPTVPGVSSGEKEVQDLEEDVDEDVLNKLTRGGDSDGSTEVAGGGEEPGEGDKDGGGRDE